MDGPALGVGGGVQSARVDDGSLTLDPQPDGLLAALQGPNLLGLLHLPLRFCPLKPGGYVKTGMIVRLTLREDTSGSRHDRQACMNVCC